MKLPQDEPLPFSGAMPKKCPTLALLIFCPFLLSASGTWSQWRGDERDGKGSPGIEISASWDEREPELLWESDLIPSQDDGGFEAWFRMEKSLPVARMVGTNPPRREPSAASSFANSEPAGSTARLNWWPRRRRPGSP